MTPRSVQGHIEAVPLSAMQWRLWFLASAGKFFEGFTVFAGGIALPLLAKEFGMSGPEEGLVTAASLFGILIGALLLGGLADRFGRRPIFTGEMVVLGLALLQVAFSPGTAVLVLGLFVTGLALGADYPTALLVLSESIPSARRGRLVLGAFAFQALGALVGSGLAWVLLQARPALDSWRLLYLLPVLPVLLVAWGRMFLPESSHWLISRGQQAEAQTHLRRLLVRHDLVLPAVAIPCTEGEEPQGRPEENQWRQLLEARYRRAVVLTAVPWFLQDLATYGIGIFTPVILANTAHSPAGRENLAALITDELLGARGTTLVNLAFLLGIGGAIQLADRLGRIPLQILGFIGCAVGLLIAAVGSSGNLPLLLSGFLLFQFMTNLGPNSQSYLLAGEVFPVHLRGLGAGFAAAAGKVGAVLTAFFFPLLLTHWGSARLLPLLALTSLAGALITWMFRIETSGLDLERL